MEFWLWNHAAPMPSCVTTKYVKFQSNLTALIVHQCSFDKSNNYNIQPHICGLNALLWKQNNHCLEICSLKNWFHFWSDLILYPTKSCPDLDKFDANINLYGAVQICQGSFNTFDTLSRVALLSDSRHLKKEKRQSRFNTGLQFMLAHRCCSALVGSTIVKLNQNYFQTTTNMQLVWGLRGKHVLCERKKHFPWNCVLTMEVKSKTIWNNSHSTNSGPPFSYMSGLLLTTYIGYRPDTLHKIAFFSICYNAIYWTIQFSRPNTIQEKGGKRKNIARGTTNPDPDWGSLYFPNLISTARPNWDS